MSKLSPPLTADKLEHKPSTKGPVLRKNRKKPLHPEAIHDLLREKTIDEMPKTGWSFPLGWLLILWKTNGQKLYRDLSAKKTYEEAVDERDWELETGDYEKAWLIKKTGER